MVELQKEHPLNFDYLEVQQDPVDHQRYEYCSFNLYESKHYEIIHKMIDKWFLGDLTQFNVGTHIHDKILYQQFMDNIFPSKVNSLKIFHGEHLGE